MTEHLATEPPASDPVTPPLPDHLSVVLSGHRAFRRGTAAGTSTSPHEHAVIWAGSPLPLRVVYRLHLHRSYRASPRCSLRSERSLRKCPHDHPCQQ
jgi:hypothetical protein